MRSDQKFLLYPLDTGEDHICLACGQVMRLFADEAENEVDILTFVTGAVDLSGSFARIERRYSSPVVGRKFERLDASMLGPHASSNT
jgi:hypothetical protein